MPPGDESGATLPWVVIQYSHPISAQIQGKPPVQFKGRDTNGAAPKSSGISQLSNRMPLKCTAIKAHFNSDGKNAGLLIL
jgi:hypothetical protein